MNKNILSAIGIFVAIVLGLFGALRQSTSTTTVQQVPTNVGAVNGPDLPYPYITVGGVRTWFTNVGMTQATTTVCALVSPVASSTLVSASASFSVSSTTATTVTMAKASTAFATTTAINTTTIAANGTGIVNATTSPVTVFGPSQFVVIGVQGGTGTFSPTGRCMAVFRETDNVQ